MQLDIDNGAAKRFTEQLRKLPRTAIAIAVKETLNKAAYDVKLVTMPKESKQQFVNRRENFFKANSKAEGQKKLTSIANMKSTVGFYENKLSIKTTNYAVKDLEQQEKGGVIDGRAFRPLVQARKGNSDKGDIKPNARLKEIRKKGIINSRNSKGANKAQKFLRAAAEAGKGGYVIGGKKGVLFKVDGIIRKSGKIKFTAKPLYTWKRNRTVKVNKTGFMKTASISSAKKMELWYIAAAEKQINYWANKAK